MFCFCSCICTSASKLKLSFAASLMEFPSSLVLGLFSYDSFPFPLPPAHVQEEMRWRGCPCLPLKLKLWLIAWPSLAPGMHPSTSVSGQALLAVTDTRVTLLNLQSSRLEGSVLPHWKLELSEASTSKTITSATPSLQKLVVCSSCNNYAL